ncbi:hypothetical protein HZA85_00960 [Candidatus Uhrbacteria bacterium]|nr:hypothetical protein [Candidatus Uhrbacteria bacterium]
MLKVAVIVLVFAGALFMLAARVPESVFARSTDGVVTLAGISRLVRQTVIEPTSFVAKESPLPRVSSFYVLTPDVRDQQFSPTLTLPIVESWKPRVRDLTELIVYSYTDEKGWQPLATSVDLSSGTLEAQITLSAPTGIAVLDGSH